MEANERKTVNTYDSAYDFIKSNPDKNTKNIFQNRKKNKTIVNYIKICYIIVV